MRLHLNENPYDFPYFLKRKILKAKWNIYEEKDKAKKLISEYEKFPVSGILPGNGADEIIFLIMLAFNKKVVSNFPSFSGYKNFSQILDRDFIEIELDENFDIDDKNILKIKDGILFIANPSNPTSNLFSEEKILKIVEKFNGIVAIDETYIDFSEKDSYKKFLNRYKNLIIIKSFSKSFSLAGIRFGYAISNREIIEKLEKKQLPYSLNSIALSSVKYIFENIDLFKNRVLKIIKERERMISEIKKTGLFILPSKTNFLFIKIKNRSILKELKKEKLMFKIFDLGKKGEFVRISIGKKRDNNKILEITRRYQNEGSYF